MGTDQELAQIALAATKSVEDYLRSASRTLPHADGKRDFHDPVTVHDREVEKRIRKFICSAVPGSRFLGEETGEYRLDGDATDVPGVRGLGERVRWIVDPIDGTANFAAGLLYFCTSIAVELDGGIVAAAINAPMYGESFVADSQRAWHIDPSGVESALCANGPHAESAALLASYYPGLFALDTDPEIALRHDRALRSAYGTVRDPGAGALDLAHVSAGWMGACMGVTFGPWDVAAGIHLVRKAGGTVLNLPLGTSWPEGMQPGVLASGANLDPVTARRVLLEVSKKGIYRPFL